MTPNVLPNLEELETYDDLPDLVPRDDADDDYENYQSSEDMAANIMLTISQMHLSKLIDIIDNIMSIVFGEEGCGDSGNSVDSNGEVVDGENNK